MEEKIEKLEELLSKIGEPALFPIRVGVFTSRYHIELFKLYLKRIFGEIAEIEIEDSAGETIWVFNIEGPDYFGVSYHERSDFKITELTHLLTIEIPNEQILDKLITGPNQEDLKND